MAVSALMQEEVERYYTRDLAQLTTRIPGVQIGHAAGGGAGGSGGRNQNGDQAA